MVMGRIHVPIPSLLLGAKFWLNDLNSSISQVRERDKRTNVDYTEPAVYTILFSKLLSAMMVMCQDYLTNKK